VKLSIRWIATGTRCVKYGKLVDSCHLCDEPETHNHLFQCHKKDEEKAQYIQELAEFLGSIKTHPHLTHALTMGIEAWLHQTTPSNDDIPQDNVAHAPYANQSMIGWDITMAGIFHTSWAKAQDTDDMAGRQWQAAVTRWMIIRNHNTWINRCSERRSITESPGSQTGKETMAQLEELHQHNNGSTPARTPWIASEYSIPNKGRTTSSGPQHSNHTVQLEEKFSKRIGTTVQSTKTHHCKYPGL
jgi:hypothetical protein